MQNISIIIFFVLLTAVFVQLVNVQIALKSTKKRKNNTNKINSNNYSEKPLMTKYEKYFFDILVELESELGVRIQPQVNLATILHKENNNHYISELFRNIDFAIFSKDYAELILLIEINDSSHNSKDRIERDKKVDTILSDAGIKLIKFYSHYSNKREYVKERVKEEIINVREKKAI